MPITGHAVLNACPPLRIERRPPGLPPAPCDASCHTPRGCCVLSQSASACQQLWSEQPPWSQGNSLGSLGRGPRGQAGRAPPCFCSSGRASAPAQAAGCRPSAPHGGAEPGPAHCHRKGWHSKPLNCALSMAENLSALSPGGQTSRPLSHTQTRAASPLGPLQQEPLSCTRRCGRAPPAAPCPSTSAGSCCPGSSCGASSARPGTCPAHPLCSFAPSGTSSAQPANQTTKRSWGGSAHPSRPEGSRNHPAANPMGAPQGPQPRPPGMKTRLGKPAQPPRAHPAWWMVQRRQGRETAQVRGGQAGSWGAAHTVLFIESG